MTAPADDCPKWPSGVPSFEFHTTDADCTLGPDDCCTVCGVSHAAPCDCGGRGFHRDGCPESDAAVRS